jgi:hypothetical protein
MFSHHESEEDRRRRQQENRRQRHQEEQQRREQATAQAQNQADRDHTVTTLNKHQNQMNIHADQGYGAKSRKEIKENARNRNRSQNPSWETVGAMEKMGYTILALSAIAVISINYFLINAPVSYLASMSENDLAEAIAPLLVPVALLIFELALAWGKDWAENKELPQLNLLNSIKIISFLTILVTPAMIIGTMLAREDWFLAYNFATSFGMIILAAITDALIVFQGERIYVAFAFWEFQFSQWSYQNKINHYDSKYRLAGRKCEQVYSHYYRIFTNYNKRNPNHPLPFGPFNRQTANFLNQWLGYIAIEIPDAPAPETPPTTPLNNPAPNPTNPPIPNTNEAEVETETEAEAEYYRQLLQNQVRNNEREVRPD